MGGEGYEQIDFRCIFFITQHI